MRRAQRVLRRLIDVPPERYGRSAARSLVAGILVLLFALFVLSWLVLVAALVLSCGGNNCPGSTDSEAHQRIFEAILYVIPLVVALLLAAALIVRGILLLLLRARREGAPWWKIGTASLGVLLAGPLIIVFVTKI